MRFKDVVAGTDVDPLKLKGRSGESERLDNMEPEDADNEAGDEEMDKD
jgi:hypothetical protein